MLALGAAALAAPVVTACPASALLPCLASARVTSAAPAVAPVGAATRVVRARAALVGLGRRRGARVRHDAASLVAGQRRWLSGAWARVGAAGGEVRARGEPEGAAPQKSHVIPSGQFLGAA